MTRKFWNFAENKGERTLYLNGNIAEDSWFGDEVTPEEFKAELLSGKGDVTVWINSNGGDFFASARIYNLLKEYPHKVTVKIDGIAASAASVVAMSGDEVLMSPVSCIIIHNPFTMAVGDSAEMLKTKSMLDEVKEAIINAYQNKTHLSRQKLAELMDEESCFSAKRAVELGFADGILYDNKANVLNLVQGLQSLPKAFQIPLQNAGVQVAHQPKVTAKNADFSYTEKQLILMKELL